MTLAIVTDGGRGASRSALAVVRALGAVGVEIIVAATVGGGIAARSRFGRAVEVPAAADPRFAASIEQLRASSGAAHVFATSDVALEALAHPSAPLVDKSRLATELDRLDLATPVTEVVADLDDLHRLANLSSRHVLKPLRGAGRAGVLDRNAVDDWSMALPVVAQPFIDGPIEALAGVMWEGELRAAVHQRYERTWPTDCGTASSAVTVPPDLDREADVTELLQGHDGTFQVQYVGGCLIDVNPRAYGSMPLAVAAGVNLPAIELALVEAESAAGLQRGAVGVRYRWFEGDLRHLSEAARRRTTPSRALLQAVRPRRRTTHSVCSLSDPGPMWARGSEVLGAAIRGLRR